MSIFIQEKISELNRINRSSENYLDKYNEILRSILSLKEIYTVISKNATEEDIKNNNAKVFFGLNNSVPTMWLFSEKEIAMEYADYYQFKKKDIYLIKTVDFKELLLISYFAMFSGICQVIIDEGREFLICNIYDLVNECFIKQGQPLVLDKSEYPIMSTLNSVRFANNRLWIVSGKCEIGKDLLKNKFIPVVENDCIKIFINESDCKKYAKEHGSKDYIIIDININGLQNIIKVSIDNNIKNIEFVINNEKAKMNAIKLSNILERMS